MIQFTFTKEQLSLLQIIVSHAYANKQDAEDELDVSLDGIEELEKLLYQGEQQNLELFI